MYEPNDILPFDQRTQFTSISSQHTMRFQPFGFPWCGYLAAFWIKEAARSQSYRAESRVRSSRVHYLPLLGRPQTALILSAYTLFEECRPRNMSSVSRSIQWIQSTAIFSIYHSTRCTIGPWRQKYLSPALCLQRRRRHHRPRSTATTSCSLSDPAEPTQYVTAFSFCLFMSERLWGDERRYFIGELLCCDFARETLVFFA